MKNLELAFGGLQVKTQPWAGPERRPGLDGGGRELPPQPATTFAGSLQPASPRLSGLRSHSAFARLFTVTSPVLAFPQPPHGRLLRLPTAAFPASQAPARPAANPLRPAPPRPRARAAPPPRPGRGREPAWEEVMEAEGGGRAAAGKRGGRALGSSPAGRPPPRRRPLPRLSPHAASSRRPPRSPRLPPALALTPGRLPTRRGWTAVPG